MRELRFLALLAMTLAVSVGVAFGQSLAEVAKKEKERRNSNKEDSKTVITDRELSRSYGGLPTTLPQQASSTSEEGVEGEGEADAEEPDEETVDETKTAEYWQNRVRGTKEKIAQLEQQLSSDDWGQGQRVGVDPRGQANLAQRQRAEQQLAAARAELEAIRTEARRAGVPPGWVR